MIEDKEFTLATRQHEIACGHRVVGHEGKCQHLHGHNYVFTFKCMAQSLDSVGRVIDFGQIKQTLCHWLEANWDHRFLAWEKDEQMQQLLDAGSSFDHATDSLLINSVVWVPFNPTAENIAQHMVRVVGPEVLPPGIRLVVCGVGETGKCGVEVWAE